jgi:hypothetical protein
LIAAKCPVCVVAHSCWEGIVPVFKLLKPKSARRFNPNLVTRVTYSSTSRMFQVCFQYKRPFRSPGYDFSERGLGFNPGSFHARFILEEVAVQQILREFLQFSPASYNSTIVTCSLITTRRGILNRQQILSCPCCFNYNAALECLWIKKAS